MNAQRERPKLLQRADAVAPWVVDGALALVVLVVTLAAAGHGSHSIRSGYVGASAAAVISASVLSTLPLLVRRRWPVEVLAATLIVGIAIPTAAVVWPPALVAVYTVASRRPWRIAVVGAVAAAVGLWLHRLIWGYSLPLSGVITGIAFAGAALALGLYQATRLAYFDQQRERAARLERERELLDEQAAAGERLRIARELHDVIAHDVSLMVIQAQALEATAKDETARHGAHTIAELGRDAMGEMHRTLELMRADSTDEERRPQPALDGLGRLVERAHTAGVDVELSVAGAPRPLPTGVEVSAYRIVQEALTNVIKHSGSDHASVELRYGREGLELEIVDQGANAADPGVPQSGHGLVGMRERVALFGGTLEVGPVNGRGYRVLATLPYAS
ncbi:MAG: sensor histidine kinase [Solirubrobacterales bacterium]|nr:sensor histidine kinase [Solirubrobacterales bacterium]